MFSGEAPPVARAIAEQVQSCGYQLLVAQFSEALENLPAGSRRDGVWLEEGVHPAVAERGWAADTGRKEGRLALAWLSLRRSCGPVLQAVQQHREGRMAPARVQRSIRQDNPPPGLENRAAELGELVQPVRQGCEAEAEHSLGAPGVQIFNQDIDERTASSPASLESRIQGLGDVQVTEFGVGEAATLGY